MPTGTLGLVGGGELGATDDEEGGGEDGVERVGLTDGRLGDDVEDGGADDGTGGALVVGGGGDDVVGLGAGATGGFGRESPGSGRIRKYTVSERTKIAPSTNVEGRAGT